MVVFSINNNKEPKKAQKTFNKYNLLYKRFPANHLRFPLMCPLLIIISPSLVRKVK